MWSQEYLQPSDQVCDSPTPELVISSPRSHFPKLHHRWHDLGPSHRWLHLSRDSYDVIDFMLTKNSVPTSYIRLMKRFENWGPNYLWFHRQRFPKLPVRGPEVCYSSRPSCRWDGLCARWASWLPAAAMPPHSTHAMVAGIPKTLAS